MKKIYFLLACSAFLSAGKAQNLVINDETKVKRCATVEALADARRNNPHAESEAQFESWINGLIQQRHNTAGRINTNYNLPVVFHIVHNGQAVGTTYNVAQSKIIQQVLQLNKDYANLSNSPYTVSAATGIQFSLAQKDPYGNVLAEPGIDRISRTLYGWTDPTTTAGWTMSYITGIVKPASIWDPTKYINIWLVPSMPTTGGEILGYSTFPGTSTLNGLDNNETNGTAGVVLKYSVVGSIFQPFNACTDQYGFGKTLTHELGHFFGLRHIWGDATCATDYVNDTPVHETSNSGVPAHPKSNNCGTADEMFENYMDYTDDRVLNTFTANQVDRMQTVMANSSRRVSLATSTVGLIPATGTNRIAFSDCNGTLSYSEAGTTGTYPRYRDITLYLNVEDKATGAAIVTLVPAGTAVLNRDYIITTPSTINFVAGDNYKPVTIRLLDNTAVDGDKTLILSYLISGTGVSAGITGQTETITITDDDNLTTSQNPITLINEGFEGALPGWATLSFTANPVNFFTTSTNGNAGGSGACAHITNNSTTRPNTYTKTTAATVGLRVPLINASQLQNLTVSFNYRVWGEVDAGVPYDYGRLFTSTLAAPGSYTSVSAAGAGPYAGVADSITGVANVTFPASFNFSQFYLAFLWINDAADGNNPPINIDNVVVKGNGVAVETAVSSSYGYDVPSATINNFRSSNGKSILALTASSANLTNVSAAVTEAGVDRPTFSANGTTYMRSRKVISLTSVPAGTGQYTVKLYYTSAELAAWGTSVSNLRIMKVNAGVSLATGLNTGNALIGVPTLVEDSSASRGYYAFTATFTGTGQYVLVSTDAVLPVKWLSFTGTLEKSKARLSWKTADEINNKGFEVERSIDAVTFTKIGWVNASATNSYELYDATIAKGNKYYYRLKQIDKDGNYAYSPVISILYLGNDAITVYPNPVKNSLVIQQTGAGRTSVVVTDLTGKTVYSNSFAVGTLKIDAQMWSNGVYMVRVIKDNEISTFKVMKQ